MSFIGLPSLINLLKYINFDSSFSNQKIPEISSDSLVMSLLSILRVELFCKVFNFINNL